MKRIKRTCRVWILLLCAFSFLMSCDNNVQEDALNGEGKVPVTVNVDGGVWNMEQGGNQTKSLVQKAIIPVKTGCITATLETSTDVQTRATGLASGVKYRIIIYRENDISATGYISHTDCTAGGTAPVFYLLPACTYTFVCYTYGTTTELPAFSKDVATVTASPLTHNLMYCKKNIKITDATNVFAMELSHLFSKITVVADATSDDYNIKACSAVFAPNYQATMSLADGSLVKGSSITQPVTWPSLNDIKITSSPILVHAGGETVSLNFSSITIADYVLTNMNITFAQTLEANKNYTLKVMFNSKNNGGIKVPGQSIYWAPGNLIGTSNGDGTFSYSFASTQEYYSGVWNGGDYWSCGESDPTDYTYDESDTTYVDPCRLVSPAGTWRLPTSDEFQALRKNLGNDLIWTTKNGIYGRYFGTSVVPASGTEDNYLFLPAAGFRYTPDLVRVLYMGETGDYWFAGMLGNYYHFDSTSDQMISMFSSVYGLSIRCVTEYKTTDSSIKIGDWTQDGSEWNGGTQTYIKN